MLFETVLELQKTSQNKEQIYQVLLAQGHKLTEIENAFEIVEKIEQQIQDKVKVEIETEVFEKTKEKTQKNRHILTQKMKILQDTINSTTNFTTATSLQNSSPEAEKIEKTEKNAAAQNPSTYIWILAGFGSVLVGLGFVSLVAANWDFLPDFVKILLFSLIMLLFYGFAFWVENRFKNVWLANLSYLTGSLVYGANIFLISQIYNIPIEWQDGFLYWFIGVLSLAIAKNSHIIAFASIIIYYISAGFFVGRYFSIYLSQFSERHSFFILILATISVFFASYFYRQKTIESFAKLEANRKIS